MSSAVDTIREGTDLAGTVLHGAKSISHTFHPGDHDSGNGDGRSSSNGTDKDSDSREQASGPVTKSSHIIAEQIDVGVPRDVVYDQWTQYQDFPAIMKHESGKRQSDQRVVFESKIGPSRRKWTAEVVERQPERRIAWRSVGGAKNIGVVTFHELDRSLTRLMVEMEFHPRGFFETVGNALRMPRRRVRKDLKLFKNYIELMGEATGDGPGGLGPTRGLQEDIDKRLPEPGRAGGSARKDR